MDKCQGLFSDFNEAIALKLGAFTADAVCLFVPFWFSPNRKRNVPRSQNTKRLHFCQKYLRTNVQVYDCLEVRAAFPSHF